jgi:type IV pilus assembly protein PilM
MKTGKQLIINCGSTHVSAAIFSSKFSVTVILENLSFENLDYDYTQRDDWLPAIEVAIPRLLIENKYRSDPVLILPSCFFLHKIVRVPVVEKSHQYQIVAHEVEQNIPDHFSEVVWDQYVIRKDEVEEEILIVLVKKEWIEEICERVCALGLNPPAIRSSAILDYNAFRFAYPNVTGSTLLLNIGARSTNLIYINSEKFYLRSIALGGNFLSQYIADEMDEPFILSESRKCEKFTEAIGNPGNQFLDPILQKSARTFCSRLGNEITRSIASYTQCSQKEYPQRALITGLSSLVPGLAAHLHQQLKVPVEYFAIKQRLLTEDDNVRDLLDKHPMHLSEQLGEASNNLINNGSSINLIPKHFENELSYRRRKPYALTAKCLLVMMGALLFYHYSQALIFHRSQLEQINAYIKPIRDLQKEMGRTKNRVIETNDNIHKIERLVNSRVNWINFFVDLQQRLSGVEDVWLDDLEVLKQGSEKNVLAIFEGNWPRLRLNGRMLDRENPLDRVSYNLQERVNRMLDKFVESAYVLKVQDKKFDTSKNGILAFEFTLILQPDKALW